MKKLCLTMAMMLVLTLGANAATTGYVDYVRIIDAYPLATKYKKELDTKAEALKKYLEQKEAEIQKAPDSNTQRTIRDAALKEVEKRQKDYIVVKTAREKEIDTKIRTASESVRTAKKLEVMVKSDAVVSGGIDCTLDVINLLK